MAGVFKNMQQNHAKPGTLAGHFKSPFLISASTLPSILFHILYNYILQLFYDTYELK